MNKRPTSEQELVKSILDFSFIIKGQLHSDRSALMRSILNILIMEAEDFLEFAEMTQNDTDEGSANRFS